MHEVEDLGNRLKLEGTVSLEKCNAMNAQGKDSFETTGEFIVLYYRSIESGLLAGAASLPEARCAGAGSSQKSPAYQQNIDQRNHV